MRIFNSRFEQIAVHVRHEQGRFSTDARHIAREKINGLERGAAHLLNKVSGVGPQTHQWAEAMLTARGIEGTRVLQGLISLTRKHSSEALERACEIALSHGAYRLRTLRQLLKRDPGRRQEQLPFLDEHPIIRPLDDYAAALAQALHRQEDRSSMSEGFGRHDRTKESPGGAGRQGEADVLPPCPGYPSSGCASAEPDSVSPDDSSVIPPSQPRHSPQEKPCDE